jgi:hypothetical protein
MSIRQAVMRWFDGVSTTECCRDSHRATQTPSKHVGIVGFCAGAHLYLFLSQPSFLLRLAVLLRLEGSRQRVIVKSECERVLTAG